MEVQPKRLSLFQIESELLQLIDAREDVLERMAGMSPDELTASPEIGAELATIEGLIRDYVGREIRKVDGIATAIKEFQQRALVKTAAAKDLELSAKRDADTVERIKATVLQVLQEFGEKKLAGRLFTISRQGNGGVAPLVIAQPDLVPKELQRVTVTCSRPVWDLMRAYLNRFWGDHANITADDLFSTVRVESEPDPKGIREVLEAAQKQESALYLESAGKGWTDETLKTVLSKVQRVPGCRLEERGEHIRVK